MTPLPPTSRRRDAGTTRLVAAGGLLALVGGFVAIALSSGEDTDPRTQTAIVATTPTATAVESTPVQPTSVRVPVTGIGAYDPDGDRSENDGDARLATDGVSTTAWKSEHYRRSFAKTGVGLVVDAGHPVTAGRVVVVTETPGYKAEVKVGTSPQGPFVTVSKEQVTKARTTFVLDPRSGRYLVLWITSMPTDGIAAVNEITASTGG